MTAAVLSQVLLLLLMLGGSFFFSSSETALFSLSARHFVELADGDTKAERVRQLLARPYHLLVLLLLGNNVVNIAAAEFTNRLVTQGAETWRFSPLATTLLSIAAGTVLLLLAGEIGPKTLAMRIPLSMAKSYASTLLVLQRVLAPVVDAFHGVSNAVLTRLGLEGPAAAHVSEEELKTLVDVGEEEGVIDRGEREMISRVFGLGDTLVREVFVPRPDVVRVSTGATVRQVLALSAQYGHARIPVVGDTVDDVRGICHVKDLIPCVRAGRLEEPADAHLRDAKIVPDTKRVDECLREFLRERTHMAVVVDEYGGTAGIVTLEDLLEMIVGDIFDEYDDYEAAIVRLDDRTWRVDAGVALSDLEEAWGGSPLRATEFDTLGGLVLDLFGRFPYPGESVEQNGVRYTVETVSKNRLQRILVSFDEELTIGTAPEPPHRRDADTGAEGR